MSELAVTIQVICIATSACSMVIIAILVLFARWWLIREGQEMKEQTAKWDREREDFAKRADEMRKGINR